jgi:2'-hydroxyisoflavone reductase
MHWLVIGGTQFVGHHIVQAALAAGERVTLFNRGLTAAELPAGVQRIIGDRKADLSALREAGPWDAVIDCCAYLPRDARRMAEALRGKARRYALISTISVYADMSQDVDENSPLARTDTPDTEVVDGQTYGPLKALCEAEVQGVFSAPGSCLILRPGLVVGPRDPTQRFPYWPARLARAEAGEPVLAPGAPADALRFIDARDLAEFTLHALRGGQDGVFNVVSDPGQFTIGALLQACAAAAAVQPAWCWLDGDELQRLGLRVWIDLPVWLPPARRQAAANASDGYGEVANARARAAGLQVSPLQRTVQDTLAWWRSLPPEQQHFSKAGLSPEREAQALAAWRAGAALG